MDKTDNIIQYEGDSYIPKYTPDWNKLAELINSMKGPDRSMGKFADQCNISRATFTRIVRGYYVKALSMEMLDKIIENAAADCEVTMKDMLRANGYAPQDGLMIDDREADLMEAVSEHKIRMAEIFDILTKELYQRQISFTVFAGGKDDSIMEIPDSKLGLSEMDSLRSPWFLTFHIQGYDPLYIKFNYSRMKEWMINSKESLWNALNPYFPLFLRVTWEPECSKNILYYIIFTSENTFQIFTETMKEIHINNYISAVLIDLNKRKIVKEFSIPRHKKNQFTGIFN